MLAIHIVRQSLLRTVYFASKEYNEQLANAEGCMVFCVIWPQNHEFIFYVG